MKYHEDRKSGVALVIVLGLVAVLLIMCVAFSINMRVERAGASNLRHAAIARQLTKGAMAAAIAALDSNVTNNINPVWFNMANSDAQIYGVPGTGNYWRDTFASTNAISSEHIEANFFTPEVEKYFPSGLAFKGYATRLLPGSQNGGDPVRRPEWVPVFNSYGGNSSQRGLIGRYAYFVMNTTDLLDISVVGRLEDPQNPNCVSNRWMGYSPREIRLSQEIFDEISLPSGKTIDDMIKALDKDGPYESIAELQAMREKNKNDNENYFKNLRSFNTFSYEPTNFTGKVNIGGSADDLRAQKSKIIDAFKKSGLDDTQAKWAYLGLIDYVDNRGDDDEGGYLMERDPDIDIEPWERPATEPMPLMSGFVANIIFEKRELPVEAPDSDPADPIGTGDDEHWEIRVSCEVKIPFVFPFSNKVAAELQGNDFNVDFELDGKARLALPGGDFADGLVNYSRIAHNTVNSGNASDETGYVELVDDCYINGLSIVGPWVKVSNDEEVAAKDNCKYIEDDRCFPRGDFFIQAAGATLADGEVQRRFPLDEDDYKAEGDDISDAWMTAHLNTASDVNIGFPDAETTVFSGVIKLKNDEGDMVEVTVEDLKYWRTNIVVWAEFLDPRFSCMEMYGNWEDTLKFYRPSHLGSEFQDQTVHHKFGTTELPQTSALGLNKFFDKAQFRSLVNWARNDGRLKQSFGYSNKVQGGNDCEIGDVEWSHEDKPGGWMDHEDYPWPGEGHPTYFQTSDTAGRYGASPFTSYIMTHPNIVTEVYQMNMDGVRIGDDTETVATATTDSARKKWRMHVKNSRLESVGELGYLPIGIWHTIRLYDYGNVLDFDFNEQEGEIKTMTKYNHIPRDIRAGSSKPAGDAPFHTVLDHFFVNDTDTHGRVSLNCGRESTLSAVFYDMPLNIEQFDNEQLKRIEAGDAQTLAFALTDYRSRFVPRCAYANLSQLGYIFNVGEDADNNKFHLNGAVDPMSFAAEAVWNSSGGDFGEWEREAVIRNSCGLFSLRGQTYIIAARGESYSPIFGKTTVEGGTVNAARTAVAQVWRDTVPENPDDPKDKWRYPFVFQFFKILDD